MNDQIDGIPRKQIERNPLRYSMDVLRGDVDDFRFAVKDILAEPHVIAAFRQEDHAKEFLKMLRAAEFLKMLRAALRKQVKPVEATAGPTEDAKIPEQQILMANGKTSTTYAPPFDLIPTVALERLAERFRLGEERKGDKAWNAGSNNQEVLRDLPFVLDRLNHVIHHSLKLRDKLMTGGGLGEDDDAAAIAWGGVFLICATAAMEVR